VPPSVPPALTVTGPATPLFDSNPPLTTAPPLSAPAFTVVPELFVRRDETDAPALFLNTPALVTEPATAPLLTNVALLTTSEVTLPPRAVVSWPPLMIAPPLMTPPFVVFPVLLKRTEETTPLALLLKTPVFVTEPETDPLLTNVALLMTAPPVSEPA